MIEFKKFIPKIEYETTGNDTFTRYVKIHDSRVEYNLVYSITKGKSIVWNKAPTNRYSSALSNHGGDINTARNNTRITISGKPVTVWTSVLFHPMFTEYTSSCNNNI